MTNRSLILMTLALAGCLDPDEPGNLVPKTVAEDPSLPAIEVAGALFHAETFGDPAATTVLVLHGGPGADYRGLLPLRALADDGYQVVFWDQRGTGLSQRFDRDDYTYELYLEDLRLVIEQTVAPEQSFVFIGHSWGAMYATWFINEYGDYGGRLRGAVLSEPGAFTKAQLEDFMEGLVGSVDLTGEQLNDVLWSGQFMSPEDHARADYLAALFTMRGAPSEQGDPENPRPFWRAGAAVNTALLDLVKSRGFDWTTHLDAFEHQVLFLRGDRNTVATLEHQRRLAASYPNAEVVTIADAGHEMIWEQPDQYLVHARDYFRSIGFEGGAR